MLETDHASIQIREAAPADAASIAVVDQSCLTSAWSQAAYQSELTKSYAWLIVAETVQGQIVGFINAHYMLGEVEIMNFAVLPAMRRRGIASQLLEALIKRAELAEAQRLSLEVATGNEAAQALYFKAGFQQVGRRKAYYAAVDEDALILAYTLPAAD